MAPRQSGRTSSRSSKTLERRFGRDAVVTLIGSLARKALWPIEEHAVEAALAR